MADAKIRLHVNQPLGAGQPITLNADQANYLFNVMRLGVGAAILVFDGENGEWRAEVTQATKRGGILVCTAQTTPLRRPPDLWLLFAPIKKARTDFIVEKATELGAARILPVQTRFTNADRIRQEKLQAHAVEAAEQCGATFVPEVSALQPLDKLLDKWPQDRRILWCNEHLTQVAHALPPGPAGPWAILVGPEGGFSDAEQTRLAALPFVTQASLGPRILRADTAALAAITLWQAALGDWQ